MSNTLSVRALPSAACALLVAGTFVAVAPVALEAQVSRTTGPMLGAHIDWASTGIEDADRSSGAGFGGILGYGFDFGLAPFVQVDHSNIDVRNQPDVPGDWEIWQFDLGARYHFGRENSSLIPFVQGAGSLLDVHVTNVGEVGGTPVEEIDLRGFGGTLGAGLQFAVTPSFSFQLSALFTFGNFGDGSVDGVDVNDLDIAINTTRLNIGLAWWPVG